MKDRLLKTRKMISDYVRTVTGITAVDVEVIEGTPVLSRDGLWHIYFLEDRMRFIGVCDDEDIDILKSLSAIRKPVLDIYHKVMDDEAVQQ